MNIYLNKCTYIYIQRDKYTCNYVYIIYSVSIRFSPPPIMYVVKLIFFVVFESDTYAIPSAEQFATIAIYILLMICKIHP